MAGALPSGTARRKPPSKNRASPGRGGACHYPGASFSGALIGRVNSTEAGAVSAETPALQTLGAAMQERLTISDLTKRLNATSGGNPRARRALGRLKTGEMNKTEAAYRERLEALRSAGEIVWWKFEGLKLRLADATFLTVDFFVMRSDGALEAHEVKGFMEEDANVKLKVAASLYPFAFKVVKKQGNGWTERVV